MVHNTDDDVDDTTTRIARTRTNAGIRNTRSSATTLTAASSDGIQVLLSDKAVEQDAQLDDAVKLIAGEMNRLSVQDREKVFFELHGVEYRGNNQDHDNPKFLAERLALLQEALDHHENKNKNKIIPGNDNNNNTNTNTNNNNNSYKNAYDLAATLQPDYVKRPAFRLMFLRADHYDPQKAALRLVRHFETKLGLFGEDLLCKDITQDDLDPLTLNCLYSGWIQDLPLRDASGRLVSIMFTKLRDFDLPVLYKLQRIFYAVMALSEEEDNQKCGRVTLIWGSENLSDRETSWKTARIMTSLPMYSSAIHFCYQPEHMSHEGPILALGQIAMEKFTRLRVRYHVGSLVELKFALQTFGIKASILPITFDGEILFDNHRNRWARRRREERMRSYDGPKTSTTTTTTTDTIMITAARPKFINTPRTSDVLLGRGRFTQEHIGNVRFRHIIGDHQKRYDAAFKSDKTLVAEGIVRQVHGQKGRFLREEDSGWIEVDDQTARIKVSACFRTSRSSGNKGISTGERHQGKKRPQSALK